MAGHGVLSEPSQIIGSFCPDV